MDRRAWLIPVAFGLIFALLAGAVRVSEFLVPAGLCLAAGAFMLLSRPRRDPYDLGLLREIDEEQAIAALDPDAIAPEADSIMCPRCHHVYGLKFRACPQCGTKTG